MSRLTVAVVFLFACQTPTPIQGPPGASGPTGASGSDGASGAAGARGDTGALGLAGTDGTIGSTGPAGPSGADATPEIAFGDGSAGEVTIASSLDWGTSPPADDNYQFTTLTVAAGITLTVPSGTTIRCTGAFVNQGTIIVTPGSPAQAGRNAERALSRAAASAPSGGLAITRAQALLLTRPLGAVAGAGNSKGASIGGDGGGVLVVRARAGVSNEGSILADGGDAVTIGTNPGAGGGAGGLVVLLSRGSIANGGTISASGGDGSSAGGSSDGGGGGGGGGGIVYLLGPDAASTTGVITVVGGAYGAASAPGTAAGGGGGALGGDGGSGSDTDGSIVATNGATGLILRTQVSAPDKLLF